MRGYIRKRGSTYAITVSAGADPVTGKRRQIHRTAATKKDAERELVRILRGLDSGSFADPGRLTVAVYLEQWLDHARSRVRPRTFSGYEGMVRRHLIPALGEVPLAKLRPLHIQAFEARALEGGRLRGAGGLSPRTVLHLHRVISEALRQAVRWQLLSANPAAAVQPPRPARPELVTVGPELAGRILSEARGTELEVPVTIALGTGMRRGEILALRWVDVDFEEGRAHVRRSLQVTARGLTFEEPKTDRSRRAVSMPAFAVEVLRRQRRAQAERRLLLGEAWQDNGLVMDRGDGSPVHPDLFSQAFTRFARKAGFPGVRFHDLRHGHATLMLSRGVHPKVVSERLGHAGVGITLDTYSHVIPALQSEAAAVMDDILGARG